MTKGKLDNAPDQGAWPSLEDLKFLDNEADPGAAMGMFVLPHPSMSYELPASHDVFGTDLLGRHEWRRSLYVQEFLCETDWKAKLTPIMDAAYGDADFETEVQAVFEKLDDEPEQKKRRDDILGETVDYLGVFENTLHIDSFSHPLTIFFARVMMRTGWEVAVHFKEKYGQIRPVKLDPLNIKPIIRTPSHPSFPSAHATQAHLAKLALSAVIDGRLDQEFSDRMNDIANEIAVNREYAGVHYASDSTAGMNLAQSIWDIAVAQQAFKTLIAEAKAEWDRPIQAGLQFFDP
ncbi:MAG: hypothetical protein AAF503_03055 [Pseudomonadota bacterium]